MGSPRNRGVEAEARRGRVLAAAITLAAERGIESTTVAAIAERAEVTPSHLFWTYGDKDALFAEALEWAYSQTSAATVVWHVHDGSEPLFELLARNLEGARRLPMTSDYWRLGILLLEASDERYSVASARFRALRNTSLEVLSRWWQAQGVQDLSSVAGVTLAVLDGLALQRRIGEPATSGESVTRGCAELLALVAAAPARSSGPTAGTGSSAPGSGDPAGPSPAGGSAAVIVAATVDLLKERGVDGATVAEISRRSQLPPTSLYWHFQDKTDLLIAALDSIQARWLAAAGRPGADALGSVMRAHLEVAELLELERSFLLRSVVHEPVAAHVRRLRTRRLEWLTQADQAGLIPIAPLVVEVLLDGLSIRALADAEAVEQWWPRVVAALVPA